MMMTMRSVLEGDTKGEDRRRCEGREEEPRTGNLRVLRRDREKKKERKGGKEEEERSKGSPISPSLFDRPK
jgi:hypothetical protein